MLGLDGPDAYRDYLIESSEEWRHLDMFCRIPISRFYRDREVFRALKECILPALARHARARGEGIVRCWCAGCASGEEPYSVAILWRLSVQPDFPGVELEILGTDADGVVLRRAQKGCYAKGSLKELPARYLNEALRKRDGLYCVDAAVRRNIRLEIQDIRTQMPDGPFDLVLCRNVVFTYFGLALQQTILAGIGARLGDLAYLVIGSHERLPADGEKYTKVAGGLPIYLGPAKSACANVTSEAGIE